MNWYVAKVIFRIISNEESSRAQFDEQLRLVSAQTKCSAFEKATVFGRESETRFNNHSGAVKLQFVNVAEVNPISALEDGAELYCNIHECETPDVYIGWANHKAALITLDN